MLRSSPLLESLIQATQHIRRIGLVTSIRSTANSFREELAAALVHWLKDLSLSCHARWASTIQDILFQELCDTVPGGDGLIYLDELMVFDSKLWKSLRSSLSKLYVNSMVVAGEEKKRQLAFRFTQSYLRLAKGYLFQDREADLSILHFSVQLFTVPSIAEMVILETNVLYDIMAILKALFLIDTEYLDGLMLPDDFDLCIQKCKIESNTEKLSCNGTAFGNNHIAYFFNDIRYLVTCFKVKNQSMCPFQFQGNRNLFKRVLDLVSMWNGMHAQIRMQSEHIEYETEAWVNAFNLSMQIERILFYMANSFLPSVDLAHVPSLVSALVATRQAAMQWFLHDHLVLSSKLELSGSHRESLGCDHVWFYKKEFALDVICDIPYYRLSLQEASLHYPINWIYSHLISILPKLMLLQNEQDLKATVQQVFNVPAQDRNALLLTLDYAVRSLAFSGQIKSGIWVRNGASMRTQAYHYRDLALRSCRDLDISLIQLIPLVFDGDYLISLCLERFEITDWISNLAIPIVNTIYDQSQYVAIVQDFLNLMITVLTERSAVSAVPSAQKLRTEIIHHLAASPSGLPYSELNKRIADSVLEEIQSQVNEDKVTVDSILKEVAEFRFPDGTTDHGLYQLKDHLYKEVYPWFWHYTRNQREEVEDILKNKLKPLTSTHGLKILPILPNSGFEKLDATIHSKSFIFVVFYSLWNSLRDKPKEGLRDELIIHEAVHLIVIAFEILKSKTWADETSFIKNAVHVKFVVPITGENESESLSMLEYLLSLIDRAIEPEIKEISKTMRYLVSQFEEFGGHEVELIISGWRDKSNWNVFSTLKAEKSTEEQGLTDAEKQKKASKARKAAIMAQFAQAQQSFMANFGEDLEDGESMDEDEAIEFKAPSNVHERMAPFPVDNCIVCQEKVLNNTDHYGMLCMIQTSNVRQLVAPCSAKEAKHCLEIPPSLDIDCSIEDLAGVWVMLSYPSSGQKERKLLIGKVHQPNGMMKIDPNPCLNYLGISKRIFLVYLMLALERHQQVSYRIKKRMITLPRPT